MTPKVSEKMLRQISPFRIIVRQHALQTPNVISNVARNSKRPNKVVISNYRLNQFNAAQTNHMRTRINQQEMLQITMQQEDQASMDKELDDMFDEFERSESFVAGERASTIRQIADTLEGHICWKATGFPKEFSEVVNRQKLYGELEELGLSLWLFEYLHRCPINKNVSTADPTGRVLTMKEVADLLYDEEDDDKLSAEKSAFVSALRQFGLVGEDDIVKITRL